MDPGSLTLGEDIVRRYAARSDQDLASACAERSDPYAYLALYSRHCAGIREQLEAAGLPRFVADQRVGAVLDAVVSPSAAAAHDGFSACLAAAVRAVVAQERSAAAPGDRERSHG